SPPPPADAEGLAAGLEPRTSLWIIDRLEKGGVEVIHPRVEAGGGAGAPKARRGAVAGFTQRIDAGVDETPVIGRIEGGSALPDVGRVIVPAQRGAHFVHRTGGVDQEGAGLVARAMIGIRQPGRRARV